MLSLDLTRSCRFCFLAPRCSTFSFTDLLGSKNGWAQLWEQALFVMRYIHSLGSHVQHSDSVFYRLYAVTVTIR